MKEGHVLEMTLRSLTLKITVPEVIPEIAEFLCFSETQPPQQPPLMFTDLGNVHRSVTADRADVCLSVQAASPCLWTGDTGQVCTKAATLQSLLKS